MAHVVHVPAWKKLGLKLKYVKDISIDDIPIENTNVEESVGEKKRKQNGHIHDNTTPVRPAKKAKKALITNSNTNGTDSFTDSIEADSQDGTVSPSLSKRKSVSFTPDTKTKDGESTKELYRAYRAQQEASLDNNASDANYKAPTQTLDGGETAKLKKGKKDKSRTLKKSGSSSASTDHSHTPGLQYLIQYYADRKAWKFSKYQQTVLLKYIFDPGRVPLSYDLALQAYLSGLESSSQRKRLRDIALEIRKFDEEFLKLGRYIEDKDKDTKQDSSTDIPAMDQAELDRRSAQYNQALAFYKKQLKSQQITSEERQKDMSIIYQGNLQRRKRAELVLSAVGESEPTTPAGTSSDSKSTASTHHTSVTETKSHGTKSEKSETKLPVRSAKKIRKRKRRTQVSDEESSSSSSSSSSSDSDSDVEMVNGSSTTTQKKKSLRTSKSDSTSNPSGSNGNKAEKARKLNDTDTESDKYSEAATFGSTEAEFSDDGSDGDDDLTFEDSKQHAKRKEVVRPQELKQIKREISDNRN
ncbi:MAG: hypothetical protein MMC33_001635 [Icmadophila ericetorum]|nr:hypothetical protein [Icmadophila ericetorum]